MVAIFNSYTNKALYRTYANILFKVVEADNLDPRYFIISKTGLAEVIRDVKKDLEILKTRRSFGHGFSKGKIVGTIVFRLCREHKVVIIHPYLSENKLALHVPIEVTLALGLELVGLSLNAIPNFLLRELKFHLAKRHINQEALGICFDTLSLLV